MTIEKVRSRITTVAIVLLGGHIAYTSYDNYQRPLPEVVRGFDLDGSDILEEGPESMAAIAKLVDVDGNWNISDAEKDKNGTNVRNEMMNTRGRNNRASAVNFMKTLDRIHEEPGFQAQWQSAVTKAMQENKKQAKEFKGE